MFRGWVRNVYDYKRLCEFLMHKNPWVIVIGYSGSGKTTISEILRQRGVMSFEFFDYFKSVLGLLDDSRHETLKKVKEYIQSKGRQSVISDIILWIEMEIHPTYNGPVFLIGARHSEDIKILKTLHRVIFCVLVHSSDEKRINRIINRGRAIDKDIISDLINRGVMKVDPELTNCIKEHTNYFIENNGEITDLIDQINLLLNTLEGYYEF